MNLLFYKDMSNHLKDNTAFTYNINIADLSIN